MTVSLGRDRYVMDVYESSLKNIADESPPPNVCILGLMSNSVEQAIDAIKCIQNVSSTIAFTAICSSKPTNTPIILVAYKESKEPKGQCSAPELEQKLAQLSYAINAHRCLDCSAINRVCQPSFFFLSFASTDWFEQ
ncbi:unnamed protein product [Anisakis simplex]|uniref:Uncharacterized protein n=1 Tax=Anisakis simplex TaxID=6269 RepID=A0A3P6NXK7_ANISI|nr:unnamed protein product [Anisakis simplex]